MNYDLRLILDSLKMSLTTKTYFLELKIELQSKILFGKIQMITKSQPCYSKNKKKLA